MNKKKIVIIAVVAIVVLVGVLFAACGGKGTRVVFTTGFAKDEIFRIEEESCKKAELMVYLTTIQNQYENVYGEEIWNASLEDVTLEENVKETVLARIAQVKTMYLLAKEKGVTLTEGEQDLVTQATAEYFGALSDREVELMGINRATVEELYTEYALAEKVYEQLIADINPEVSDDEARIITVQHILLKTYTTDGTGKRIAFAAADKQAVYENATQIRKQAVAEGQDFAELALQVSEDVNVTYSFGKGEMDKAFEEAAFLLETNEISQVVESESGYHIIKCITTFDREETDANKLEIIEKRKQEAFGLEYNTFVQSLAKNLNRDLWEEIDLIYDESVTTDNFFAVYEKYFTAE